MERGPLITPTTFQGINYLDERRPLAPQLQASPWPSNFRAGAYPKYSGSTDPAQYIMSYQVAIASSGGHDATMAKSLIIALKGTTLTWYTRLPPLSIESWKALSDKLLLNFQGYRPDIDALAELSLYRQQEKETLREYYKKFLLLNSQLPSVEDHIAIHYAISGLCAGVLYSHCIRDPPKKLQELYQLFEKYARSEEQHQCKIESQWKPKDTPQSSRKWVRPAQSKSGRPNCNQQQVNTITNQHPTRDTARRQEYPHKAVTPTPETEARLRSREGSTISFTTKTAHIPPGIAPKLRPPKTKWLEISQPTTNKLLHIPTIPSNTTTNNVTTKQSITSPIICTNNTKRFKSSLHLHTTKILHHPHQHPNKRTSPNNLFVGSST
jgi:hypothetical protein